MKVSIIIPTNRYGGFDITFSGLGRQTFDNNDWEIIIIDDFIENRRDECIYTAKKYGIKNFSYLRSKPSYWRSNCPIANSRNTGLIYAKGYLIIFLDDYTWVPPKFLDEHWKIYKEGKYTLIGSGRATKYIPGNVDSVDKLSSPSTEDDVEISIIRVGIYYKYLPAFMDTRSHDKVEDCGGGWFYSCNASAPLSKIIEINGFDEEFDLTREEDIDLGLRLEKVGCKFCYIPSYDCTVFHMDHRPVDVMMKEKKLIHNRYRDITYSELRGRYKTESNIDEVQLVLKEKYDTKYDGSWGLHEIRRKDTSLYANIVNGTKIFDLKKEREKIGN